MSESTPSLCGLAGHLIAISGALILATDLVCFEY
jgi:hypothetical protein